MPQGLLSSGTEDFSKFYNNNNDASGGGGGGKVDLLSSSRTTPSSSINGDITRTASQSVLHFPIIRHYYSHKIPHRATLVPPPIYQLSLLQSSSFLPSNCLKSLKISENNKKLTGKDDSKQHPKMPRKGFDSTRRMPIVVIPRKRKYKNYVSRRRNTQLLANLRRCLSDPMLYKSFNHWQKMVRPFTPSENPPSSLHEEASDGQSVKQKGTYISSNLSLKPVSDISKIGITVVAKAAETKSNLDIDPVTSNYDQYENGQKIGINNIAVENITFDSLSDDFDTVLGRSIQDDEVRQPSVGPSNSIRTLSPKTSVRSPKVSSISARSGKNLVADGSLIRRRVSNRAKKDELLKKEFREYVNLSAINDNLARKEEERSAEQKAQKTVTAVTAAFSTLQSEQQPIRNKLEHQDTNKASVERKKQPTVISEVLDETKKTKKANISGQITAAFIPPSVPGHKVKPPL